MLCVRCRPIGYCTAGVDKRVRSTSLYHCRQCSVVLKPRWDRIDCTVVCFMTHDCSRKLRKHSASWAWFKFQVGSASTVWNHSVLPKTSLDISPPCAFVFPGLWSCGGRRGSVGRKLSNGRGIAVSDRYAQLTGCMGAGWQALCQQARQRHPFHSQLRVNEGRQNAKLQQPYRRRRSTLLQSIQYHSKMERNA